MPREVEYNGVVHSFPDDFTDEDVSSALASYSPVAGNGTPPPNDRDLENRNKLLGSTAGLTGGASVAWQHAKDFASSLVPMDQRIGPNSMVDISGKPVDPSFILPGLHGTPEQNLVKGIIESIRRSGREFAGRVQPGMPPGSEPQEWGERVAGGLSAFLGGRPEAARERKRMGDEWTGGALAEYLTTPILMGATPRVAKKAIEILPDASATNLASRAVYSNPQPGQLMNTLVKTPNRGFEFDSNPGEEAVRQGIVTSKSGIAGYKDIASKAKVATNTLGQKISSIIEKADPTPDIDISDAITKPIDEMLKKSYKPNVQHALEVLKETVQTKAPQGKIGPKALWEFIKTLDDNTKFKETNVEEASVNEAFKQMDSAARDKLESRVREIKPFNKPYSNMYKFTDAADDAVKHWERGARTRSLNPAEWWNRYAMEPNVLSRMAQGLKGKLPPQETAVPPPWQGTIPQVDLNSKFGLKPFGPEENPAGMGPLFEGGSPTGSGEWKTPAEKFEALPDVIKKFLKLGI